MKTSLLVAALLSLGSHFVHAAADYFLKIDGIKGESFDAAHADAIEVSSFSWGATNIMDPNGGGGAGKAVFQDLHFTMAMDKSSPELLLRLATGTHIKDATLTVRRPSAAGAPPSPDFYEIHLEEVFISSYQVGGTDGAALQQSLSMSYAKITFTYTAADGTAVKTGWDLKTNTKI